MKHVWLILFFLLPLSLDANQRAQGFCQQGAKVVVTSGLNSTTKVQASYPLCTVTVYLTGTLTLATIYSDNSSTPLANPFTADSSGYWFWYAANGRYDVKLSGGGLTAPWTIGDVLLSDPAGGGTSVTSFNSRTGAVAPAANDYTYRQVQHSPGLSAPDFNFTAQAPGGSLSIGSNTVTLTPCPLGVGGSDRSHWYYISGGVGSAEAVLSTGGTCTSGASSGTLIVTAANTHSGAWVIGSATAGGMEALNALPLDSAYGTYHQGTVIYPDGDYILRAGLYVDLQEVTFTGASRGGTRLAFASTIPGPAASFTADSQAIPDKHRVGIHNLTILSNSTTQDSLYFNGYVAQDGGAPSMASNLVIVGGRYGLNADQIQSCGFRDLNISGFQARGVSNDVTGGTGENVFDNVITSSNTVPTAIGFYEFASTNPGTAFVNNYRAFGTYSVAVKVESTGSQLPVYFFGVNVIVDGAQSVAGIDVKNTVNFYCAQCWVANGYSTVAPPTYAVIIEGSSNVNFIGGSFGQNVGANLGGDILISSSDLVTLANLTLNGVFRAIRMSGTSTKLILTAIRINTPGTALFDPTEVDRAANALQYAAASSPSQWMFNASSYLNDLLFTNIETGATNPNKYLNVDSLGCLQWLNSAHSAVIWKLCNDGRLTEKTVAFASIGSVPAAGTEIYCTDCTTAAICAGSGSGHKAVSNGTNWTCQ